MEPIEPVQYFNGAITGPWVFGVEPGTRAGRAWPWLLTFCHVNIIRLPTQTGVPPRFPVPFPAAGSGP